MRIFLDGKTLTLVAMPELVGPNLISGQYLAMRTLPVGSEGNVGLLRTTGLRPGSAVVEPVHVIAAPEVPEGILVVPAYLLTRLGLTAGQTDNWKLEFCPTKSASIVHGILEVTEEMVAEDLSHLRLESLLCGHLVYAESVENLRALRVELQGGAPLIVRALEPTPLSFPAVFEFGVESRIEIFFPRAKSGVDMVILADVSGSMSLEDLSHEAGTGTSRIRALRDALENLLNIRRELTGRVSRLALVAFDQDCTPVYPVAEGMVEFDALSEKSEVRRFEDAIQYLEPKGKYTDIGRALSYAAQLLWRHGRSENERLIVLISDGADWAPSGTDATGELQSATKDPVSLFADLSDRLGIRLHAVAVSSPQLFEEYARLKRVKVETWMVPNHALLNRLAEEGSGELSRTGARHELIRFFADLGEGHARPIGSLQPRTRSLLSAERHVLEGLSTPRRVQLDSSKVAQAVKQLVTIYMDVNRFGLNATGKPVFNPTVRAQEALKLVGNPVTDQGTYFTFIGMLQQLVYEQRNRDFPEESVATLLRDKASILEKVNSLRVAGTHDLGGNPDKNRVQLPDVGAIHQELIGARAVRLDDSESWLRLQERLLEEVCRYLEKILRLLESQPKARAGGSDEEIIFVP